MSSRKNPTVSQMIACEGPVSLERREATYLGLLRILSPSPVRDRVYLRLCEVREAMFKMED